MHPSAQSSQPSSFQKRILGHTLTVSLPVPVFSPIGMVILGGSIPKYGFAMVTKIWFWYGKMQNNMSIQGDSIK